MTRAGRRGATLTVRRTIEIDVEVTVEVSGGEPCVMWGDNAHPGSGPDVEIVSIESEKGARLDSLIDELSAGDVAAIEESAIEAAAEADDGPDPDDERDRRRDMAMEDR